MKFWNFVLRCLLIGVIAFVVGVLVSFFYFLIIRGIVNFSWGLMLRNGAVLGIVLPLAELIKVGKKS